MPIAFCTSKIALHNAESTLNSHLGEIWRPNVEHGETLDYEVVHEYSNVRLFEWPIGGEFEWTKKKEFID